MNMYDENEVPEVLGLRGSALWMDLQRDYEWDPQEVELLLETCRTLDVIDKLAESVATDGVMVRGSQGQPVMNGAVAELRQQQSAFARLVGQLNLVDAELGQVISARAVASRSAAQAKWRARKEARGA